MAPVARWLSLTQSKSRRKVCALLIWRGTFRPDRLKTIADRFGVDGQMASENVVCGRAWNSEQQCEFLNELAQRSVFRVAF